ncbi:MAG: DnaJ domain-containing protein [Phycisphaerales bacterium]|nr:DnaJ domain-containing protein [Phycisphaerales bacterium]
MDQDPANHTQSDTDPSTPGMDSKADFASRVDPRIDTKGIQCDTDTTCARVADLTGTGMRLTMPASCLPEVGHTSDYTFSDKESDNTLVVQGIVRWVRKGSVLTRKAEVGIEFLDLHPLYRDALVRLAIQGELLVSNIHESDSDVSEETPSSSAKPVSIDLYEILNVSPYASESEIKSSFHKLVKHWHPDHNDSEEAPARFEEIHKAYSVLRDPDLRARYDDRFGPDQSDEPIAA